VVGIKVDELLKLVEGKVSLIYGEAGAGKTNIILQFLSLISITSCGKVVYVSTEGPLYSAILDRYGFSENALFIDVYDSNSLLQLVLDVYKNLRKDLKAIAIDTVNNFYRVEVSYEPHSNRVFNTILALLNDMSVNNGTTCLLAAQVSGFDDDVRMSGFQILRYWCDYVFKLEKVGRNVRRLLTEFPKEANLEMRYVITSNGVEWLAYES